jgi:hypothetical protein
MYPEFCYYPVAMVRGSAVEQQGDSLFLVILMMGRWINRGGVCVLLCVVTLFLCLY